MTIVAVTAVTVAPKVTKLTDMMLSTFQIQGPRATVHLLRRHWMHTRRIGDQRLASCWVRRSQRGGTH